MFAEDELRIFEKWMWTCLNNTIIGVASKGKKRYNLKISQASGGR